MLYQITLRHSNTLIHNFSDMNSKDLRLKFLFFLSTIILYYSDEDMQKRKIDFISRSIRGHLMFGIILLFSYSLLLITKQLAPKYKLSSDQFLACTVTQYKNNSKTLQWIKLRNCHVVGG